MNAIVDSIDLGAYSINDLHKLAERVQQEIQHKQQTQILELRQRMEEMAGHLGMTPEDVLSFDARKKTSKIPAKPKYRNPDNPEQTWSGRGKRPHWLREAVEQGTDIKEFEITS